MSSSMSASEKAVAMNTCTKASSMNWMLRPLRLAPSTFLIPLSFMRPEYCEVLRLM